MRNHLQRSSSLVPTALALLGLASMAQTAHAGSYHLYSCRTPAGATAPTEGWSSSLAAPTSDFRNTCSSGGEMAAAFRGAVAAGSVVGWRFAAPDAVVIGRVRLWRSGAAQGRKPSGGRPFWHISRPGPEVANGNTVEICGQDPTRGDCVSRGDGYNALSDQNLIAFDGNRTSGFWGTVQCADGTCDGGSPLPDAFLNIHAADIELRDDTAPQANGEATGDLLVDGSVSGTRSVTAPVKDAGSGVYALSVEVDGKTLATVAAAGCAPALTADDGSRAYTQRRPCQPTATVRAELNTATVADGDRVVRVVAEDAAGNRSVVGERHITVYNTPATPTDTQGIAGAVNPAAAPGHAANGNDAVEGLRPSVRIVSKERSLTTTLGPRRSVSILGMLATADGAPVAGARLAVVVRVSGRQPEQLPGFQTSDGSGRVSFVLPPGPTRSVRLAYYAFTDSRTFALSPAVTALARTTTSLTVNPRRLRAGQLVTISGGVSRDGLPSRGVIAVVQGFQAGLGWRTFRTARVSGASGRFTTRYRIRFSSNRLRFRIVIRNQEGYPYATTVSRSRAVTVR